MADYLLGPRPGVNLGRLDEELRAAFPDALDGISQDKTGNLTVHVKAGREWNDFRAQLEAAVAAHDPAVLSRDQIRTRNKAEAVFEAGEMDYAHWHDHAGQAKTVAALAENVQQLWVAVWALAAALDLAGDDNPGGSVRD